MGINHTTGKKKQWAKIAPEVRSKMMSERAAKGWAKKTPDERKAHSEKMIKAKLSTV